MHNAHVFFESKLNKSKALGNIKFCFKTRTYFQNFCMNVVCSLNILEIICWPTDMKSGKEGFIILSRQKDNGNLQTILWL